MESKTDSIYQHKDEEEPAGLYRLPKMKNKPFGELEIQSRTKMNTSDIDRTRQSELAKVPKVEKKTLKTTKDVLESITMIK